MRDAIREFYEYYYSSPDFKLWRDEFSGEIYTCLTSNIGLGEVQTVTELCDVMNGKRYRGLRIESKKTHSRSTSGVQFDYIGKQTVTELADMVFISIITFNREILLLKTAFVQNKKAPKENNTSIWSIDQKQLFLLKNFPTFKGVSGIFNSGMFHNEKISFLNHSNTLGNFGLFSSNGELIFLTAKNTFCTQGANGRISLDNMKNAAATSAATMTYYHSFQYFCRRCHKDCFYDDYMGCFLPISHLNYMPFFNNYAYALGVHEVVKDLTYFNIGEPSSAFGKITNEGLYNLTGYLLYSAFGYKIGENNFNYSNNELNNEFWEGGINIILNHLELGKQYS